MEKETVHETYLWDSTRDVFECIMSHIWMSHVTHLNESRRTFEWVMSHIWMSHKTYLWEERPYWCTIVQLTDALLHWRTTVQLTDMRWRTTVQLTDALLYCRITVLTHHCTDALLCSSLTHYCTVALLYWRATVLTHYCAAQRLCRDVQRLQKRGQSHWRWPSQQRGFIFFLVVYYGRWSHRSKWVLYTSKWVLYISKWVLYISKWVLYTSKWVLYTSKWVLYTSKWVLYTSKWVLYTSKSVLHTRSKSAHMIHSKAQRTVDVEYKQFSWCLSSRALSILKKVSFALQNSVYDKYLSLTSFVGVW